MISKFRDLFFYAAAMMAANLSPALADVTGGFGPERLPRDIDPNSTDPKVQALVNRIAIETFIINSCTVIFFAGSLVCLVKSTMQLRRALKTKDDLPLRKSLKNSAVAFGSAGLVLFLLPFLMAAVEEMAIALAFSGIGLFLFFQRRAKAAKAKAAETKPQ